MYNSLKSNSHARQALCSLMVAACCLWTGHAVAQTLTVLHQFGGLTDYTNGDGAYPIQPALVATRDVLYGVTTAGGIWGEEPYVNAGTIFQIHTNGSGFGVIYYFNPNDYQIGGYPFFAGLTLRGDLLYGTTRYGDENSEDEGNNHGAVFTVNTNNNATSLLYDFGVYDDFAPVGNVAVSADGAMVYGALSGDAAGDMYSLGTDGLSSATSLWGAPWAPQVFAGLILSPAGNTLYGVTGAGDSGEYLSGSGTIFSMCTNGAGRTIVYQFTDGDDGSYPWAGLIQSGDTLYGTTRGDEYGSSYGSVFACTTNGTFTLLHDFNGSDGAFLQTAPLLLIGNTLYGTSPYGGTYDNGTIFQLNTDGTGFQVIYNFSDLDESGTNADGAMPLCGLTLWGGRLYGATTYGGYHTSGTIYAFDTPLTPKLINVQITHGGATKSGTEQAGFSGSDQWNVIGAPLYDGDEPAPGDPAFGAYSLVDYAGNITSVGVMAYPGEDPPFATSTGVSSGDALFQSCGLTGGGADWELHIVNLPPGTYDIYLYSAMPGNDPVTFTLTSGGSGYVTVGSSPNYGEFSSLTKSDYGPIVIDITGDVEPVCNGLQIYRH